MAKFKEKLKAYKLRRRGISINRIAKSLHVSKSIVSIWCRDIKLTSDQIEKLIKDKESGITKGRLKGALMQKMKRVNAIKKAEVEAESFDKFSREQFWIAGLALYLAEGSKKMGRVQFTNSDPKVINLMLKWFDEFFSISRDNIRYSVLINIIHKKREKNIISFWTKYLKFSSSSFTSVKYVVTKQKKIYANYNNYFGTFSFRINKSTHLLYKLNAFITRLLLLGDRYKNIDIKPKLL